jgi:hypothetical protein
MAEVGRVMRCRNVWAGSRRRARLVVLFATLFATALVVTGTARPALADQTAADLEFFESKIRPLLIEQCGGCHGEKKQWGGLRLDSSAAVRKGGETGPAVVPGSVDKSLLIQAVRRTGDLEMPPDKPLPAASVALLEEWVRRGAPWPESDNLSQTARQTVWKNHWAFQPVRAVTPPVVNDSGWSRTGVDPFIWQGLSAKQLAPAPEADPRTLIRRVTYDLTGLPPTPEEVARFVADPSPAAYAAAVERLLESPTYGEHWARHWLDVARYSDTKGYVYAREERFFTHSSLYRDWVVDAFQCDLPYDRFLLLQLAADRVDPDNKSSLAAMGYLTLGRRFIGVTHDIIDDRIDVVTRGMMGLTVTCARCHDHKFDPIPTADYYSLYGIFQSSIEKQVPVAAPPADEAFLAGLREREQKLADVERTAKEESAERARTRLRDYLLAQKELEKYPEEGFDIIIAATDLVPAMVRHFADYLDRAARRKDPVFAAWHRFAALTPEEFGQRAAEISTALQAATPAEVHPAVAQAFATPPENFAGVVDRYVALFERVNAAWKTANEQAKAGGQVPLAGLPIAEDEALRQVLYGEESPCRMPDEPIVSTESYFDSGRCNELWKLQGDIDRYLNASNQAPYHTVAVFDRRFARDARILKRGNPKTKGDVVPRRFLSVVAGDEAPAVESGSGRLELAQAIVAPTNPLTARVWVNRVWQHHFGAGLVRTPSDFGVRASPPSHPELLDWLARQLVESGWSTKAIHRLIVLSATYRQASNDPALADRAVRAEPIDPEDRLFWRAPPRRLGFEEYRDSLLAVSGELDRKVGGRPADLFNGPPRRSLYGLVDRQFLPGVLRMFDFANPDLHTPQRLETVVPQQALFATNHPFVANRARALAARVRTAAGDDANRTVQELFQAVLQRSPTEIEVEAARAFITAAESEPVVKPSETAQAWSYGWGKFDPQAGKLSSFQPLPHFTGAAWQGGGQWPDATLGWAQLTATGGHPGNDLDHAAIRRWTAPRAMRVAIQSEARHEPMEGDGFRASIVSGRVGQLASLTLHHRTATLAVNEVRVEAGETLDFVADVGGGLGHDQFLWSIELKELPDQPEAAAVAWRSAIDFIGPVPNSLNPWEQLAQVLLVSNEFLFID